MATSSNLNPNVNIPMLQRLEGEYLQAVPECKAGVVRILSRFILQNELGQFIDELGILVPFGGQPVLGSSVFTGFIVNEGYIVPSAHGVCDWYYHSNDTIAGFRLRSLEITDIGGDPLPVGIITQAIAVDTGVDLALLPVPPSLHSTFSFKLAAEGNVAVGQSVFTFGNPIDYPWDFKSGKVAHVMRLGNDSIPNFIRSPVGFYTIEVDFATPPGFSGGPQITSAGEVIGVNQSVSCIDNEIATRRYNFISFVVPVKFLNDLMLWFVSDVKDGDTVFRRNDGKGQFHINLVGHAQRIYDPKLVHVLLADMDRIAKGLHE